MPRLAFLGAARSVTGSQYLLEAGGERILVDSGLFQGDKALRQRNWAGPPFDPRTVSHVVLTHTHLDHIGRVPRLVKQGFRGTIWATPPTKELAEVLLLDAAHLQQEDADYLNRKNLTSHEPALPLFDTAAVQQAMPLFRAHRSRRRARSRPSSPSPIARPGTSSARPRWSSTSGRTARRRASCSAATWGATEASS